MALEDKIIKAAGDRTKLIDAIIEEMEKAVSGAQRELLDRVVEEYVDKLEKDADGNIKNSLGNKRKIALLDNIYNRFIEEAGVKLVNKIVKGVTDIVAFNGRYFSAFASKTELGNVMPETETTIKDWLGITPKGNLVENGYLETLVKDPTIKNQIRNDTFKAIVS